MQENQVPSLGGEDPLEKEMATGSSILTWEIPWAEEPGGRQSTGSQRVKHWASEHNSIPQVLVRAASHKPSVSWRAEDPAGICGL